MLKVDKIDYWIISFLFLSLPLDMVNGILLRNSITLPISVSQIFKILILIILIFRVSLKPVRGAIIFFIVSVLLLPTIYQLVSGYKDTNFLFDCIKIFRYIMPIIAYMFFSSVFKNSSHYVKQRALKFVRFSYIILVSNILVKHLGFGYPIYDYGDIGSKGFFYAGNEISALLVVLSSIIAKELWLSSKKTKYVCFFILNIIVGLTLTSKTSILGVILMFFLIPVKPVDFKLNVRKIKRLFLSVIFFIVVVSVSWSFFKASPIFLRISFFWKKLDIVTFIFSKRNVFASNAWEGYIKNYNFLEKIIGVGQSKFENISSVIEIGFLDIFFPYGIVGAFFFIVLLIYFFVINRNLRKRKHIYRYSQFVYLVSLILLIISTMAGHVFNSGMSGPYLGLLLSLMYYRNETNT